jgi:hypothetical protein
MVMLPIALLLAATAGAPSAAPGGLAAAPAASTVSVQNRVLGAQPGNTLTLEIGTQTTFTAVDGNHVQGHTIDLQRFADRLRGFVGDEETDLQLAPDHITGHIGTRPVSLDVARTNGGLEIHGDFGRRAVALTLHPNSIEGDVGPCRYALRNHVGDYIGTASCGGRPTPVRMELPVALVTREDSELAAIITALFAA